MTKPILQKLEETRRYLLDLTRRNRLLNHRPRGRSSLQIADELPEEIFRLVAGEGKMMQFLSIEEAPAAVRERFQKIPPAPAENAAEPPDTAPSLELPLAPMAPAEGQPARYSDSYLQTLLPGEKLQAALLHLARQARSAIEEQGSNILYLTLGLVEWRESKGGDECNRAPLVFLPVELRRKSARSRHALQLLDDDILANPCLSELCKRFFNFDLPPLELSEDFDLKMYLKTVEVSLIGIPGWRLLPEIHLGLFSFAKFLMYRDLDPDTWPAGRKLSEHPLVRHLCGFDAGLGESAGEIPDPRTLDDLLPLEKSFQVVDADSSQLAAILAAKRGLSLVIDGPPGTGKSQTITNIIAECLADGKTVLFVAEKAAALEVVKSRLAKVGLEDFILDLHSRWASKRLVLENLQKALAAEKAVASGGASVKALEAARQKLNAYARELHQPFGQLGLSPFDGISRATELFAEPQAVCELPDLPSWTLEELAAAVAALEALDRRLERAGDPAAHPWRGAGVEAAGLALEQAISLHCRELLKSIAFLKEAAGSLAGLLGAPAPGTANQLEAQVGHAGTILNAPRLPAASLSEPRWNSMSPELGAWLDMGRQREELKEKWLRCFVPQAEEEDWSETLGRRETQGPSLLRLFRPSWHRDSRRIKSFLAPGAKPALAEELEMLKRLAASRGLRRKLIEASAPFSDLFGPLWQGVNGDWKALRRFAESAAAIRKLVLAGAVDGARAGELLERDDRGELAGAAARAEQALQKLSVELKEWFGLLTTEAAKWFGREWAELSLEALEGRFLPLPPELERLQDWADLVSAIRSGEKLKLKPFIDWALGPEGAAARGRLPRTFERLFFRFWTDRALADRPALAGFRGEDHRALIDRFQKADRAWLEANRRRLIALLLERRPDLSHDAHRQSKLGILKAEMRKKRHHMPLRRLFAVAGDLIQSIKPCLMMSPISVAQYLEPGGMQFDVVIFDEASQVEPADAYGAIARGRQLLLIGDEKQLPPTSFFNKIEGEETGNSAAEGAADIAAGDLESILSLGIARFPERLHCSLRWHYRSLHESLIHFSNERFYDSRLRIFPSCHTGREELGLAFRSLGGVYRRGAGQFNPAEAQLVAEEVLRHARERPHLSLGVGAFSISQQRAIEDEIERRRRDNLDEAVEKFFDSGRDEAFFVKNLETIQGDERDVIFLSVGYGKDSEGKLSMNFGPLNRDGGWRRLNVLVTRARRRCVVFSSIRAEDLDLSRTSARGVAALKEYLYAAEHGRLSGEPPPPAEHPSPFEAAIGRALRGRGWGVQPQKGAKGFGIDLAVVDPDDPGRYLLGIECDGGVYASSPTARDRDRLRPEVLEKNGWRIERLWSADCFRRPERALAGLIERLEAVREKVRGERGKEPAPAAAPAKSPAAAPPADPPLDQEPEPPAEPAESAGAAVEIPAGLVEYKPAPRLKEIAGLKAVSSGGKPAIQILAAILAHVVAAEQPIHEEEALRRAAAFAAARVTRSFKELFSQALLEAVSQGKVRRAGSFLWQPGAPRVPIRWRGGGCPATQPDLIAMEELEAAVKLTLLKEFGLSREALCASTGRLLGYRRSSPGLTAALERAVDKLLALGEIEKDSHGFLVLAEKSA